jgi:hypothetical protein
VVAYSKITHRRTTKATIVHSPPNKTPPFLGAFYCLSNKGVQAVHFYDTSRLTTESPAIPYINFGLYGGDTECPLAYVVLKLRFS